MIVLSAADSGRQIDLRPGDEIRVELSENAATGYRWSIEAGAAPFVEALPPKPDDRDRPIGSGGTVSFAFRAASEGSADLLLRHWREWEGDGSVIGRFRLAVRVRA